MFAQKDQREQKNQQDQRDQRDQKNQQDQQGPTGPSGPSGSTGPAGPSGPAGPTGVSGCECCLPGLRAVLGYLKTVNATDIRVETVAPQPAVNNQSITRFYHDANDASTAVLVQFSNGTIVSICEIELIQSRLLIDSSSDFIPDALKAALDETIAQIPDACKNCCQEELRTLFANNIGNRISNIGTNRDNVISGNNTVRATGAGVVVISIPGNDGATVNLCYVSSVNF